jgi:hypothetical protein
MSVGLVCAYVRIRQHTSAYADVCMLTAIGAGMAVALSVSACLRIYKTHARLTRWKNSMSV